MIRIYFKELNAFLYSLIAYLVIGVFLLTTGLFTWVFPDTSVLSSGYAGLDTLFSTGPYLFMFLIPAITMRSLAEEKKAGTLDLLFTKPLSDLEIVSGKMLAGFSLVVLSILPTLVYYVSVYQLGNPKGNLDSAGIAGSYVGLLLLGGVFVSVGVFASSLTDNQIVSFIVGLLLCYVFFAGFGLIASLDSLGMFKETIASWGIEYHYASVSRGLIDSRDLVYFVSVSGGFLLSTLLVLDSRKW